MITLAEGKQGLKKLFKRREELRYKLKDHFCLPMGARNYKEFELVVTELDEIRKKIQLAALGER